MTFGILWPLFFNAWFSSIVVVCSEQLWSFHPVSVTRGIPTKLLSLRRYTIPSWSHQIHRITFWAWILRFGVDRPGSPGSTNTFCRLAMTFSSTFLKMKAKERMLFRWFKTWHFWCYKKCNVYNWIYSQILNIIGFVHYLRY